MLSMTLFLSSLQKLITGLSFTLAMGLMGYTTPVNPHYNGKFAQDYYHGGVDYAEGSLWQPSSSTCRRKGKIDLSLEKSGFRVHGNTVGIDHGLGVLSIFLDLSKISVKEGDFVELGQIIGTIGSTGSSTGPHLHWGLYVNGVAVDPVLWRFQGIQ